MSKGNYPYAELKVRLRFNRYTGLYVFDRKQYHKEFHFLDSFDNVNNAKDRSLYSVFPYLVAINMTAYYDYKTSIYLPLDGNVYISNATNYYTKADTTFLPGGYYPYKYTYQQSLNSGSNLLWVHKQSYYNWV